MNATPGDAEAEPVLLALPFAPGGRWQAVNSPAKRVPSHGSDLLATRYAIDFVRVPRDDGVPAERAVVERL